MTEACNLSDGRRIIGKDCESQRFINRIEAINKLKCEIIKLGTEAKIKLQGYCPEIVSSSESSSSSSHIDCPLEAATVGPDWLSQINVNDLDQDAYDLLELAELEACALYRKIKLFLKEDECPQEQSSSSSEESSSSEAPTVYACGTMFEQDVPTRLNEYYYLVDLSSDTGFVFFDYDTFGVPKRFTVDIGGPIVLDTGWVGDPMYSLDLFTAVGEYVSGPSAGTISYEKTTTTPSIATVTIFTPIINGDFAFTLHCPAGPSSSSSSESSSSLPSSSETDPCSSLPAELSVIFVCPEGAPYYNLDIVPWGQIDYGICGYVGSTLPPPPSGLPSSSSSSISSSSSSGVADPYEGMLKLIYNTISSTWEMYNTSGVLMATKLGTNPVGTYTYIIEDECEGQPVYVID